MTLRYCDKRPGHVLYDSAKMWFVLSDTKQFFQSDYCKLQLKYRRSMAKITQRVYWFPPELM
jgi:hypothetical protein